MFETSKYPLLNILIPLLSGMIGMSFCINIIHFNKWLEVSIILILAISTALTYFYSSRNRIKPYYFTVSFYLLFILVGAVMCYNSTNSAKVEYGDDWRFSVYRENPFQLEAANKVQDQILQFYSKHGIKGDEGAIIEAITIGGKSNISKSIKSDFSKAGVSHILALSGFHISIIYIILQFVFLSRIVGYKWKWISNLFVITCLWIYAFISGMSPSLVRSVIMCNILIIGTLHSSELISLNGLALSALIMLCINPMLIYHAGFQLSYLSMLGIYLIGIPLCKLYESYTFIDNFLWCTICITISCTIFTLPIVSHIFGHISILSVFSNIIITVLTYILFLAFFIWIITFAWSPITSLLLYISNLMIRITSYISGISYSSLTVRFSTPAVILYYSILGILIIIGINYYSGNYKKEENCN